MDENTYQLIITNKLSGNQDKNLIIKKLAALFKTSEQKAEQLLNKPKTIIKDNINRATAEKYLAAIHITGADCKIINTAPKEPKLEEKYPPLSIDNISEKSFCMECGTIMDSTQVCLHCGYDSKAAGMKNKRKSILKYTSMILGLTAIMIVIYLLALPYYNTYAEKNRILNSLELAFDTRNKITTFILETDFWPNQNIDANLDKNISNEIIESIVVGEKSVMTVTLRAKPLKSDSNKTIIFKPALLKGKLVWNCTKGTLKNEFRPDNCKSNNL